VCFPSTLLFSLLRPPTPPAKKRVSGLPLVFRSSSLFHKRSPFLPSLFIHSPKSKAIPLSESGPPLFFQRWSISFFPRVLPPLCLLAFPFFLSVFSLRAGSFRIFFPPNLEQAESVSIPLPAPPSYLIALFAPKFSFFLTSVHAARTPFCTANPIWCQELPQARRDFLFLWLLGVSSPHVGYFT